MHSPSLEGLFRRRAFPGTERPGEATAWATRIATHTHPQLKKRDIPCTCAAKEESSSSGSAHGDAASGTIQPPIPSATATIRQPKLRQRVRHMSAREQYLHPPDLRPTPYRLPSTSGNLFFFSEKPLQYGVSWSIDLVFLSLHFLYPIP